jgi:ribosomal protein S18 acetylase RimI-like enzyme
MHLDDLYVRPDARGGGHGRALLASLAAICAQRGYERFEWRVLTWNEPAIGFYRSLGAELLDEWAMCRLSGEPLADLARSAPAAEG